MRRALRSPLSRLRTTRFLAGFCTDCGCACAISSKVFHGSGGFSGFFSRRPTSRSTSGVERVSYNGFIAGPADVIDFLRVQSRSFMFTAAAVPAAIGAALGALRIIRSAEGPELMAKVLDNARYLHDGLGELGYQVMEPNSLPDGSELITPIVPVLVGDDWKAVLLWKAIYDAGVYVNVALYPAVQRGGALLRTSVMATHEREHLDRALSIFEKVKGEVERMAPPNGAPPAAKPEAGADEVDQP